MTLPVELRWQLYCRLSLTKLSVVSWPADFWQKQLRQRFSACYRTYQNPLLTSYQNCLKIAAWLGEYHHALLAFLPRSWTVIISLQKITTREARILLQDSVIDDIILLACCRWHPKLLAIALEKMPTFDITQLCGLLRSSMGYASILPKNVLQLLLTHALKKCCYRSAYFLAGLLGLPISKSMKKSGQDGERLLRIYVFAKMLTEGPENFLVKVATLGPWVLTYGVLPTRPQLTDFSRTIEVALQPRSFYLPRLVALRAAILTLYDDATIHDTREIYLLQLDLLADPDRPCTAREIALLQGHENVLIICRRYELFTATTLKAWMHRTEDTELLYAIPELPSFLRYCHEQAIYIPHYKLYNYAIYQYGIAVFPEIFYCYSRHSASAALTDRFGNLESLLERSKWPDRITIPQNPATASYLALLQQHATSRTPDGFRINQLLIILDYQKPLHVK